MTDSAEPGSATPPLPRADITKQAPEGFTEAAVRNLRSSAGSRA